MGLRIRRLSMLFAMLLAGSAVAQTYKWVDENGVTNYSGNPPSTAGAKKTMIVADRISVYTPDKDLARAFKAGPRGNEGRLSDRIGRLERQLEAERQARQYAAAAEARATQAAYDQCAAERRVDCGSYAGYYPYGAGVVVAAFRYRQPPFVPIVAVTGVTAGNVTAAIRAGGGSFNGTPGVTAGKAAVFGSFAAGRSSRGYSSK